MDKICRPGPFRMTQPKWFEPEIKIPSWNLIVQGPVVQTLTKLIQD